MSVSFIPAAPGTVAVKRSRPSTPSGATHEYLEPVVAWEIYLADDDEDDGYNVTVTPIGLSGRILNVVRIVHGGH